LLKRKNLEQFILLNTWKSLKHKIAYERERERERKIPELDQLSNRASKELRKRGAEEA
jgi:hypothetical protein